MGQEWAESSRLESGRHEFPATSESRPHYCLAAVASLVLGGLAIGCSLVYVSRPYDLVIIMLASSLVSVVLGIRARRQVRSGQGLVRGSGPAAWGIGMAIGAVFLSLLPRSSHCGMGMRQAAALNNLKQIGLALDHYHDAHGRFPPSVVYSPDGRPLYSWRVLILPYLDQKDLYESSIWMKPGIALTIRDLLARRPAVYDPTGIRTEPTLTYFQVFVGEGAAFEGRQGTKLADFPDGPERTILVVEAANPVPWTQPIDLSYVAGEPTPPARRRFQGRIRDVRPRRL